MIRRGSMTGAADRRAALLGEQREQELPAVTSDLKFGWVVNRG